MTYEQFHWAMSDEYWHRPEPLRDDFRLLFCPSRCPLHGWSAATGRSNHAFGETLCMAPNRGLVLMCYHCFLSAARFDELHLYKVLIHEAEHAVNPPDWRHSEHLYR